MSNERYIREVELWKQKFHEATERAGRLAMKLQRIRDYWINADGKNQEQFDEMKKEILED